MKILQLSAAVFAIGLLLAACENSSGGASSNAPTAGSSGNAGGLSTACENLRSALVGTWRSTGNNTSSGWRFPGVFSLRGDGAFSSGSTVLEWSPAYSPPNMNCDAFLLVDGAGSLIITYNIEYLSDDFLRIQNWNRSELYARDPGSAGGSGTNPNDQLSLRLDIENTEIWANGHEKVRVEATLTHTSLGPLSDVTILFESSSPADVAIDPILGASTDSNGVATGYVTTTALGTTDVTAYVSFDPEVNTSPVSITGIRKRAIILVPGIATTLPSAKPPFGDLRDFLANNGFMLLDYSYTGGDIDADGTWLPHPFRESDTGRSLVDSAAILQTMINQYAAANPNTGLVVLGHSQGGFLALQSLNAVVTAGQPSSVLDAIITLDGVLGGVPNDFTTLQTYIAEWTGWSGGGSNPAPGELIAVWNTAADHAQQGTTAKSLAGIRHDTLVDTAYGLGVRTLTIGFWDDCVFNPDICVIIGSDNSSTQVVTAAGSEWSMYVMGLRFNLLATHEYVLTDPVVHQDVLRFLASLP